MLKINSEANNAAFLRAPPLTLAVVDGTKHARALRIARRVVQPVGAAHEDDGVVTHRTTL